MDWIRKQRDVEAELLQMEQLFINPLVSYDKIITYCQTILETYRIKVTQEGFPDEASEIEFFKKDKPFLYGLLLQYAHQLTFELDFPGSTYEISTQVINDKIQEVSAFLSHHKDLVLYLELDSQAFDSQYFLRKNRGLYTYPGGHGHSFDPYFCTSHDGLVAQILGHQGFRNYLHNKLALTDTRNSAPFTSHPRIQWTGSKVALTELGFALYHSGAINHGNANLKSVMHFLEQVTELDLGDYHHTSIRLRNRSNPTKFVDQLKDSLLNWMAELDS